jgi:hypothetical protein
MAGPAVSIHGMNQGGGQNPGGGSQSFRSEMRRLLNEKSLLGVRVTRFMTPGIEPKYFPEE